MYRGDAMNYTRTLILVLVALSALTRAAHAEGAHKPPAPKPSVFVVVYDAGETLGLLPVSPLLEAEGLDVQWVPLTPWALRILERERVSIVQPAGGLEGLAHVKARQADGETGFWLKLLAEKKPALVIFGLVSRMQEQLAQELKNRGQRTVGFYDAFDATERDTIVWRVARQVGEVWVPTDKIKRNLDELGVAPVKVLGQPSLETWHRAASGVRPDALFARLRIPTGKKVLIFAGQYGEGYTELLEAFVRVASAELNRRDDLYLVLSPHPRTAGEVERAALLKYQHPRMLVMPAGTTTAELATVGSVVITWRSTVGVQAAFMGRPVIYFNLKSGEYTNDLIDKGIALAATPETFGQALRDALSRRSDPAQNRRRLAELGYVIDADRQIAAEVIRLVRR